MGLLRWLMGLFGTAEPQRSARTPASFSERTAAPREKRPWKRSKLIHRPPDPKPLPPKDIVTERPAYRFARQTVYFPRIFSWGKTGYLDYSQDIDHEKLARWNLPPLATPDDIATWLDLPIGKVAWLTGRFQTGKRPASMRLSHYHYQWKSKRSGGARLIEAPKPTLARVQRQILRGILDRVPVHDAAHGFVVGRNIRTGALPHCGKAAIAHWDIENFYPSVRFNRVTAIFRSLGYSREAALWLACLCTSRLPIDLFLPEGGARELFPYAGRHLPQGASTSPALANLSAYELDCRLSAFCERFDGTYTRYADDITISGDPDFGRKLRNLVPLVEGVIRDERFRVHKSKRKILRAGQRLTVTGVVVNSHPNFARNQYDRLKATLHNAVFQGAQSQNRDHHPDFEAHLRGRISHVAMLNPHRAEKLWRLFERIDFTT